MIQNKTVLAIITARGGSKGLPRKNVLKAAGKPLIAWTITEAQRSKYIDRLILSSEDNEIIEVAKQWGCEVPFIRPKQLATDTASTIDVLLHAIENIKDVYDYIVLLQPTSPLRQAKDIDACVKMCVTNHSPASVSLTIADKTPYWMYTLTEEHKVRSLLPKKTVFQRRQEAPPVYVLNGAVYVAKVEWLKRTKDFVTEETLGYVMHKERSIDIDTELDLMFLRMFLKEANCND